MTEPNYDFMAVGNDQNGDLKDIMLVDTVHDIDLNQDEKKDGNEIDDTHNITSNSDLAGVASNGYESSTASILVPKQQPVTAVATVLEEEDDAVVASPDVRSPLELQQPPSEPVLASTLDPYHPSFMFCGECTSCSVPPPPLDPSMYVNGIPSNATATPLVNIEMTEMQAGGSQNKKDSDSGITNITDYARAATGVTSANDTSAASLLQRSTFLIENLSHEPSQMVLAINALVRPLPGVSKILTRISKKLIYVDHNPFVTPASLIALVLTNQGGYQIRLLVDGGSSIHNTANPSGTCRSSLRITQGLCCNSEIPTLKNILENTDGVYKMAGVNITTRMVYVDHDPFVIGVKDIGAALRDEGFPSIVKKDGARQLSRGAVVGSNTIARPPQKEPFSNGDTPTIDNTGQQPPLSSSRQSYVESTLRVGHLSSLMHIQNMERCFKQLNSTKRRETGKRRMIRAFHPHPPSKTIKVEHDSSYISAQSLAAIMSEMKNNNGVGVGAVEVLEDGALMGRLVNVLDENIEDLYGDGNNTPSAESKEEEEMENIKFNVILSGFFWFLSMLSILGGDWEFLKYCGLLSVIFGIPPIAKKAWRTLRRCQFDANCMMLTAAFGALCLQEYDEAASVAFLFAVSEWLEARATSRARSALSAIVNIRPDYANVVNETTKEITIGVPSSRVGVGQVVSVRTGDKVPCDGVVVGGSTLIDESSLTGEARPVSKGVEDDVSGGTINIGHSQLLVRTTASVEDSAVSRLIQLVEEAQANRSPTELLVDAFAKRYTPVVVFMAFLMCTIPWAWGSEEGRKWSLNGLIIIVIACPCALTISTPVTYAAGLACTAQRGIIVKGGARLEALGRVKKVVFDKTGTLTQGKFTLTNLVIIGKKYSRKETLELLVIMEAPSSHPLSSTLLQAAKAENVTIPKDTLLEQHTILHGEGVTGIVNNVKVYVGNQRLFERLGYFHDLSSEHKAMVESWGNSGGTVGFVGREDTGITGAFCVMDTVREEAKDVIAAMQDYGLDVCMLTGDGEGAAQHVGQQLGLDAHSVQSHLRPDDKLHVVGSMKMEGLRSSSWLCGNWGKGPNLILMCGDGVNDAPALAVADIGVAMGCGAALAMEMSDVTLMDSNLKKLLFSIKMGKRVIWTIQENIVFSLLAKVVVMGFTFAGWMTLFTAIATDVGVMLIVTLNGMKLLPNKNWDWEKMVEEDTRQRRIIRRPKSKNEMDYALPMEGDVETGDDHDIV